MGRKHEIDTLHRLRDSLAYRMGLALKQLHVGLTAAIEERLRADGMDLTRPQAITLMLLAERPGVSNAELARLGGVSPQTMHQILLRLARDGLVTRTPHPTRIRMLSFAITAEGLDRVTRGAATGADGDRGRARAPAARGADAAGGPAHALRGGPAVGRRLVGARVAGA